MKLPPKPLQEPIFMYVKLGQWNLYKHKDTKEKRVFYPKTAEELDKLQDGGWIPQAKVPQENTWQTFANYSLFTPEIKLHPYNLGILCGPGNLRIIDADNKDFAQYLLSKLKTLTISTGRGLHFYIKSDYNTNHNLKEGDKNLGEYRANKLQCVAPNSRHPLGTYYKVHSNHKIAELNKAQVLELIGPYIEREESQVNLSGKAIAIRDPDSATAKLSESVKISALSMKYFGKVCCPNCRETGSYFSYNNKDGIFKCWGCGAKGNIISFCRYALNQKQVAK